MRKTMMLAAGLMIAGLATPAARAESSSDALARVWSDYSSAKSEYQSLSSRAEDHLTASNNLRKMDKDQLDALIKAICGLDIARDHDEGERLADELTQKVKSEVASQYSSTESKASELATKLLQLSGRMSEIVKNADAFRSDAEVKDEASKLYDEAKATSEAVSKLFERIDGDMKTLVNIKAGDLLGSNSPKIRAAIEYGKEKHRYNQQICEEKELSLSSGRPDCVSFQKDSCIVWEFKPSTYSESEARSQAEKYLRDVQDRFKDDSRALENCKKDSDGKPIFEARGVTYPACGPN